MTPCGRVLGTRTRANRNGSGTRNGAAASANRRDDDVEPGEPLKPSLATPWPELPKGIVGRTSATVCFLAAFDSGGGRASTRLTVSRAATRSIAARTSGLGEEVKVARRTANARASHAELRERHAGGGSGARLLDELLADRPRLRGSTGRS